MKLLTSLFVGTVCGSLAGYTIDKIFMYIDPNHYQRGISSGVIIGIFGGGIFGAAGQLILHDYGVSGGILIGVVGGVAGGVFGGKNATSAE